MRTKICNVPWFFFKELLSYIKAKKKDQGPFFLEITLPADDTYNSIIGDIKCHNIKS